MELTVFDFDDTLFITDSKVKVKKRNGKVRFLNSRQFAKYKPKTGDEFDFSDFDRIKGSFVEWTKDRFNESIENKSSKTVIITARSKTDNIQKLMIENGYGDSEILIIGTGSGDPHSKIDEVKSLIKQFNPDELIYYENCEMVLNEMIFSDLDLKLTTSFYLLNAKKNKTNYKLIIKGAENGTKGKTVGL